MEHGFQGKEGQEMPEMPNEFIKTVSDRYIELYEKITGEKFSKVISDDITARIEKNVLTYLNK